MKKYTFKVSRRMTSSMFMGVGEVSVWMTDQEKAKLLAKDLMEKEYGEYHEIGDLIRVEQ